MLTGFHILAYTCMLFCAYDRVDRDKIVDIGWDRAVELMMYAVITVYVGFICLSYYYLLGQLQYTSTSIMLAGAGYACLVIHREGKKGTVCFGVLELLAFLLRGNGMLVIQPLGIMVYLILCVVGRSRAQEEGRCGWKKAGRKMLQPVIILIVILLVGTCGDIITGSMTRSWRRYISFNEFRTELFDFTGTPEYGDIAHILAGYGISEEKYNAFRYYTILDWNEDGCYGEILEYVHDRDTTGRFIKALRSVGDVFTENYQWGLNKLCVMLLIMLLAWACLSRRLRVLLIGIGIVFAECVVWGYIFYRGRVVLRVTVGIFAAQTLIMSAVLLDDILQVKRKYLAKMLLLLLVGFVVVNTGLPSATQQYRYIKGITDGQYIYMNGLHEIQQYCDRHSENRYLIESVTLRYYAGSAFETEAYGMHNYCISGGWFSLMPREQRYLEDYLNDKDGFYYIILSDGNELNHPATRYISSEMKQDPVYVDSIPLSPGGKCTVYYFEGKFPFSDYD
ncbi:MAG: hypothetical protein IJ794_03820 [Lachnospiraceae bacterium]|nr:hypothetical protein [Lachnospiraceae bacterium]